MAESTVKSPAPMLVSLFVAAIVLVTAVVTGPTVSECASSGNFGGCLRQGLEQRGILPIGDAEKALVSTSSATSGATGDSVANNAVATPKIAVEPKMDAAPEVAAVTAPSPEPMPRSVLGLVRAEPDGSVVIAGSGTPGEDIEVFANGELIGTAQIERSGDWVLVPDVPLPIGGVEISVGSAEKANQAAQSVIVVIQEDRTTEPLVVASTPGAASQILQGRTVSDIAAAPTEDATPSDGPTPQVPESQAPAPQAPASQVSTPQMDVASLPKEQATPAPKPVETQPAISQSAKPLLPPSIDAIEVDGTRNFFAGGGEEGANVRLYVNDQFVADGIVEGGRWLIETSKNVLTDPSQRVRLDMLQTGSSAVAARAEVNFEISLPETVVAAQAAEPTTPELTAEVAAAPEINTPVPQLPAEAPKLPVEAMVPQVAPQTTVAIVPVEPAKSEEAMKVANAPEATAPIDAAKPLVEEPEPSVEANKPATALANPVDEAPAAATTSNSVADINVAAAENSAAQLASPPTIQTPAEPPTTDSAPQPQTKLATNPPVPVVAPAAPNASTAPADAEAKMAEAPSPEVKTSEAAAAVPEQKTAMATPVEPKSAPEMVEKTTELASAPTIPTLRAQQVGDPADQRFVSGNAIIRRGDNLWTIAKRVYGSGLRYTAIYDANQGQIRDPALIYPGQVFDLPVASE